MFQRKVCHGCVEAGDELLDLVPSSLLGGEVAATKKFSQQDGEPDFDLVEPLGMPPQRARSGRCKWTSRRSMRHWLASGHSILRGPRTKYSGAVSPPCPRV
jgi:hypothetical protein